MCKLKKTLLLFLFLNCLASCVKNQELKLINNFCDLQLEFPSVDVYVHDYWEAIEARIKEKEDSNRKKMTPEERLKNQLTSEEAFAKVFIEFAAKSDKTRQLKCNVYTPK